MSRYIIVFFSIVYSSVQCQVKNYQIQHSEALGIIPYSVNLSNDGNLLISNMELNVDVGSSNVIKVKPDGDTLFIKSTDSPHFYVTSLGNILSNKSVFDVAVQNYVGSYITMGDKKFNTKWQIDLSSNFSGGQFSTSPPIVQSLLELGPNRFICTANSYTTTLFYPDYNLGTVFEFDSTGNMLSMYTSPVYGSWLLAAKFNHKWISYNYNQLMIASLPVNNAVPIQNAYTLPEISSVNYQDGKIYVASKINQTGRKAMLSCIDTSLVVLWNKIIEPHDATKNNFIKDIVYSNNKLICQYQDDTLSHILNFDLSGNLLSARKIQLENQERTTNLVLLNNSIYTLKNSNSSLNNIALIKMDDAGDYMCSSAASFIVNNYPLSFNIYQDSLRPTSFTYSLSNEGHTVFSYSISVSNGCIVNSILYQEGHEFIEVYPNPTTQIINVKCNPDSYREINDKTNLQIKLTDVLGRETLVYEYKEEIDISELEKGIYFLSVYQNKALIGTKKVIKE